MSIVTRFAGRYNANDFAYGLQAVGSPALSVGTGNSATGASTIVVLTGYDEDQGGNVYQPLSTLAPITVGIGSNAETVTPTVVGAPSLAGFNPGLYSVTVSATFANLHGPQEPVTSGTYGLQEAINRANAGGGGTVVVDASWYASGGTATIIQAAVLPTNGTVKIEDTSTSQNASWANRSASVSLVAAPATPAAGTVASLTTTGTWTAVTTYVKFVYVTRNGGLTTPSTEYSFTATVSKAIGGTGPIAATDVVGYLVFIGTTTNVNYQVVVNSTNGTPITAGAITCFQIGTSFSSPTITTVATALPPTTSNAFASVAPAVIESANMATPFQASFAPFANIATVTAGTAAEWARVDLPAGFLNFVGRTLRITLWASFTPGSTATLIPSLLIESVYGTTTTTLWTVTTAATSGTTQSNLRIELNLTTAATGTAGTIEAHGIMTYASATGSAPAMLTVGDAVTAASSAANLVTQDSLSFQINSGTANLTNARVRSLVIEVLV